MKSDISIITPTYNAASTLADCLKSVELQTVSVEHIVIDGGSADRTKEVAARFPHISNFLSESDSGVYDAMNKGIAMASGDIVGILNADDLYENEEVLATIQKTFESPKIDCCYGDLIIVDIADTKKIVRYWRPGEFEPRKFYWGWMPPHPTFFVRRHVYRELGGFSVNLGTAADYELMLRFLLRHKLNVVYIPRILVRMRVGGKSNRSLVGRLKANSSDKNAWRVNELKPYPWTIPLKPFRKIPQYFLRPH